MRNKIPSCNQIDPLIGKYYQPTNPPEKYFPNFFLPPEPSYPLLFKDGRLLIKLNYLICKNTKFQIGPIVYSRETRHISLNWNANQTKPFYWQFLGHWIFSETESVSLPSDEIASFEVVWAPTLYGYMDIGSMFWVTRLLWRRCLRLLFYMGLSYYHDLLRYK